MLLSDACSAYMEAKSKKLRQTTLDGYVSGLRCHGRHWDTEGRHCNCALYQLPQLAPKYTRT